MIVIVAASEAERNRFFLVSEGILNAHEARFSQGSARRAVRMGQKPRWSRLLSRFAGSGTRCVFYEMINAGKELTFLH